MCSVILISLSSFVELNNLPFFYASLSSIHDRYLSFTLSLHFSIGVCIILLVLDHLLVKMCSSIFFESSKIVHKPQGIIYKKTQTEESAEYYENST